MKKQMVILVGFVALSTACATKGYVNEGLAEVNQKVETLAESLEDTQEATRENAEGVTTARREAAEAGRSADAAGRSADEAECDRQQHREHVDDSQRGWRYQTLPGPLRGVSDRRRFED